MGSVLGPVVSLAPRPSSVVTFELRAENVARIFDCFSLQPIYLRGKRFAVTKAKECNAEDIWTHVLCTTPESRNCFVSQRNNFQTLVADSFLERRGEWLGNPRQLRLSSL